MSLHFQIEEYHRPRNLAQAQRRQLKDFKCRINGGSGFPAAICTNGVKTIRGWKAAPTISKLYTLKTIGFFHIVFLLLWQFFYQRYLNYL